MKILKQGKLPEPPQNWWLGKKFACKNCGCQFEMEKGDHPNNDPIFTIACPTCKVTLRVTRPFDDGLFKDYESLFDQLFGKGGTFEEVFGKFTLKGTKHECGKNHV